MSTIRTRLSVSTLLFLVTVLAGPATPGQQWTFLPPATVGVREDVFTGVDGTASDDIWAVGLWEPPDWNTRCFIEHFDGVSWTKQAAPPVGYSEKLLDVLAVSRDRALAVGTYVPYASTAQPLAMEWNGTEWVLISVPPNPGGRHFEAIDQTPGGEIWVAGQQPGAAFLAHRTDGGWAFEYAPPVEGVSSSFNALHAAGDNQIWAAGHTYDKLGSYRILIRRYDGNSSWTTFDLPTPGLDIDDLWGIHAFAPNDVWAVGEYYHAELFTTQPLILHYDGTSWTQIGLPDFPEGPALLRDIAARAPDDIYAAGTYGLGPSSSLPRPLMLHYDGSTWSDVPLPPTGGLAEWFLGMAATPNGDVWAVGQYSDGSTMEPMAFRGSPTVTAVVPGPEAGSVLRLLPPYPNPARRVARIRFELAGSADVEIRVHDVRGRSVRELRLPDRRAGANEVVWDLTNAAGARVARGVYFLELNAGGRRTAARVVVAP